MRLQVPGSEQIVDIGTRKQLFIDDHIIETTRWIAPRAAGAARWVQPPDQRNDLDGWREEDDRLIVNAKTGRFIASALLDLDGRLLPGFSRADCDPFYGDGLAHPFTWRGNPDIGGLAPVRIRFYLEDAKLYALQIPKEQPQ